MCQTCLLHDAATKGLLGKPTYKDRILGAIKGQILVLTNKIHQVLWK